MVFPDLLKREDEATACYRPSNTGRDRVEAGR
jgi:hypothetical protein